MKDRQAFLAAILLLIVVLFGGWAHEVTFKKTHINGCPNGHTWSR